MFSIEKVVLGCVGSIPPEQAMFEAGLFSIGGGVSLFLIEKIRVLIHESIRNQTTEEEADDKLRELVSLLNSININISLDNLKDSSIYQTNYHLRKNGKVGIIRDRYISIPMENNNNFNDKDISIKEEHVVGSREYILSMDAPKRQLVYKKAFNM